MTTIRPVQESDRERLKAFFLSLSDETVFLNHYFDIREGKANTEIGAEAASVRLTSPIVERVYQRVWLAEELEIQGLLWLDLSWKPTQKHTCQLGIIVADKHQRRGIGTELMMKAVQEAKREGIRKIWLATYAHNFAAIKLYKKFGFEQEGYFDRQEWLEDGTPMGVVSMGKWL